MSIRVGISSCLLGDKVRYDGGDKRASFLAPIAGEGVEWVPVCPEVEMGLGVPREPIRLVEDAGDIRLLGVTSGADHTARMRDYARRRLDELARLGLCGYVFKKDSPSCGPAGVQVWTAAGRPGRTDRGLFAAALVDRLPGLPVEDEEQLADPRRRAAFVQRVFAYARTERNQERGRL